MRLVVGNQTGRDLDADADTRPGGDIGLAECGFSALGEVLGLARCGALWRPREAGGVLDAARHFGRDLQVLDQRVAESGSVPEELVVAAEGAHRAGDVIGDDIGRSRRGNGFVGVTDAHVQLRLAAPLGFRGLGAELGCHVGIGTGDLNVADSVDEILVAVRIRLASDQVALDTVPAGVAPETPGDGLLHLEHTTGLHVVVDDEGIDLVVGRVRPRRGEHRPRQRRQHHQQKRNDDPREAAADLPSALAGGRAE